MKIRCPYLIVVVTVLLTWLPSGLRGQDYRDSIGYNALAAEIGLGNLENGAGLSILQAEAPLAGSTAYMAYDVTLGPPTSGEFAGKSFVNGTTPPVTEAGLHAINVGRFLYGNTTSIAPGITDITGVDANDFVNRYTGIDTGGLPIAQGYNIANHSYIGNLNPPNLAVKQNLLRRFDYIINRDNTIAVVGALNRNPATQPTLATPDFWAPSYNAITVGLTSGNHSNLPTTGYGAGRFKPDIVAPSDTTSNATAIVGAAAAILQEAAGFDGNGNANNGGQNEVIKSILYAGATKQEFGFGTADGQWDRTTTRPIDQLFGFGELNIQNSYHILQGGEFEATANGNPATNIGPMGWDYGDFSNAASALFYDFEIGPGQQLDELSAVLAWNTRITDVSTGGASFNLPEILANLDLELFNNTTGSFVYDLSSQLALRVDASLSTDYNYEHISLTSLAAGSYTFRIRGDLATDYGFAWRISTTSIPEPSCLLVLGLSISVMTLRRRRSGWKP